MRLAAAFAEEDDVDGFGEDAGFEKDRPALNFIYRAPVVTTSFKTGLGYWAMVNGPLADGR